MDVSSAVYVLDVGSGEWSCPITKGYNFVNHSSCLITTASGSKQQHSVWVFVQSSVFVLDCQSWTWREVDTDSKSLGHRVPRSCVSHTATAVGDRVYVFGGKVLGAGSAGGGGSGGGKNYQQCTNEMRILDTTTLKWTAVAAPTDSAKQLPIDYAAGQCPNHKTTRAEHTAVLVPTSGDLYIIGGWTSANPTMNLIDTSYLSDVQIFDTINHCWRYPAPALYVLTPTRSAHAAAPIFVRCTCFTVAAGSSRPDVVLRVCLLCGGVLIALKRLG